MYIDSIELENVRTFEAKKTIQFVHPDRVFRVQEGKAEQVSAPIPRLKNVNLVFGDNASGKTTLLEAIAISLLGPSFVESGIRPRPLIRFLPAKRDASVREQEGRALISANVVLHGSERQAPRDSNWVSLARTHLKAIRKGELESYVVEPSVASDAMADWDRVYKSDNELFFVVAYGATRRVEQKTDFAIRKQKRSAFIRGTRIESIVTEGYPLIPLHSWFADRRKSDRWEQIVYLIDRLLGKGSYKFEGKKKNGDFLFSMGGMDIPSRCLSDGFRAFLGWTADLLYHLDYACPKNGADLREVPGVVIVDEIDLHLHPRWQMTVIETIAKTFPRLQFIFSSHSPLVAGSVQWMNIMRLRLDRLHRTGVDPFEQEIHGLDADQILVSDLFGLTSTRAFSHEKRLEELRIRAQGGDKEAALAFIRSLSLSEMVPRSDLEDERRH